MLVAGLFCSALGLTGLLFVGCAEPPMESGALAGEPTPVPADDELLEQVDDTLLYTYRHRHLNLADHAAWQILHGVLTYKEDFLIRSDAGGEEEFSAVEYILDGGEMNGWTVRPGDARSEDGRPGLYAELEPGTKTGQGHFDQWLAILAQCDLSPDEEIIVRGQTFTMGDLIRQVMWDVPNRRLDDGQDEYSWTLIGLSKYLPTDATWKARDGEEWSLEKIVQIEARQARDNLSMGACGGTHRLIGMTMALNQRMAQGGEITGGWQQAEEVVEDAVATIRDFQNHDGSLSVNWLERPGISSGIAQRLGCTGHQLEFLTLALNEEQIQEPWVKRAVANLCGLFEETKQVPLECGSLYHATHGLALYRERVYGGLDWQTGETLAPDSLQAPAPPQDSTGDAPATAGA